MHLCSIHAHIFWINYIYLGHCFQFPSVTVLVRNLHFSSKRKASLYSNLPRCFYKVKISLQY